MGNIKLKKKNEKSFKKDLQSYSFNGNITTVKQMKF